MRPSFSRDLCRFARLGSAAQWRTSDCTHCKWPAVGVRGIPEWTTCFKHPEGCKFRKLLGSKERHKLEATWRKRKWVGERKLSPPTAPKVSRRVDPASKSRLIGEMLNRVFGGSCSFNQKDWSHPSCQRGTDPADPFHTVHCSVIPARPICTLGFPPKEETKQNRNREKKEKSIQNSTPSEVNVMCSSLSSIRLGFFNADRAFYCPIFLKGGAKEAGHNQREILSKLKQRANKTLILKLPRRSWTWASYLGSNLVSLFPHFLPSLYYRKCIYQPKGRLLYYNMKFDIDSVKPTERILSNFEPASPEVFPLLTAGSVSVHSLHHCQLTFSFQLSLFIWFSVPEDIPSKLRPCWCSWCTLQRSLTLKKAEKRLWMEV